MSGRDCVSDEPLERTEELLLPSQFTALAPETRERSLLVAILRLAVHDVARLDRLARGERLGSLELRDRWSIRDGLSALKWIIGDGNEFHALYFAEVCQYLGFDPDAVRSAVRRQLDLRAMGEFLASRGERFPGCGDRLRGGHGRTRRGWGAFGSFWRPRRVRGPWRAISPGSSGPIGQHQS